MEDCVSKDVKVTLKEFNMGKIQDDASILIMGHTHNGSSELIKDILHSKKDIPFKVSIDSGHEICASYGEQFKFDSVHTRYDPEIMYNLFRRQKIMIKNTKNDVRSILVQNYSYDSFPGLFNDKAQIILFANGRCFNILSIFSIPFVTVPGFYSANTDYIFISETTNMEDRRKIFNTVGVFPSIKEFSLLFDGICEHEDHYMVIDKTVRSTKLEDIVFWYKP